MKINEFKNDLLKEKYYRIEHDSGLTLLLLPKSEYTASYALFATRYGSIDTKIERPDGTFYDIPEGTAHFLEHKLFESEDLDAFARFAKTGASANAFTSFDRTAYLFSCSDHFEENLEILLDFVQSPYFTAETVQKEQGIIGQEIRMYKDVPDWQVMFNLLRTLYSKHPVRIDIAGTEDSIAQITSDMLYDCYRNFYNPGNMVLAVAGKFDVDCVTEIVTKSMKRSGGKAARRVFEPESPIPSEPVVRENLAVNIPQFMLGYKEDIKTPERSGKECMETDILLDIIAGKSSPLYKELIDKELVSANFSNEHLSGFGYSSLLIGGVSPEPEKAAGLIRERIKEIKNTGISKHEFERARKKYFGRLVMMFNDIEDIANALVESFLNGTELFGDFEICQKLSVDDINSRLAQVLDDRYCALSVIEGEKA